MPLEFTSLPPAPRGMNLTAPPVFVDDMYCRWMQDILVDRPGQTRMRGPLSLWGANTEIDTNESVLGACEHYTADNDWRGAVFVAAGVETDGDYPGGNGKVYVYSNPNNVPTHVGTITLPFKLKTRLVNDKWINNTIIDAKPAHKDGVWISVFDDVTNTNVADNVAALLYWRGAGLPTTNIPDATLYADSKVITHVSTVSGVEPGMFAFNIDDGRYLGCVASVSGTDVTLEKEVLYEADTGNTPSQTIRYMSFRGFVHQYGRGMATCEPSGTVLTSGRLGSDFEGFFDAARVGVGSGTVNSIVYRQSDHKYVAKIDSAGVKSNTQVSVTSTSTADNLLRDEYYFIIRNDEALYESADSNDSLKHPMDINYRRPDQRPGQLTLSNNTEVAAAHPGIFHATYAGRQWFGSFNSNDSQYDSFINRVVFSGVDNAENVNLCQDASDSIIIPGKEPMRAMAGSNSGLLIFTESKTFIIKGTSRATFSLEELYPDGTLCASSVVQVGGGVIWAGKQGVYYYDGVTVRNFTKDALGIYYTDGIKNFNVANDRIYSFINNNYLVINFTNWYSSYTMNRWQCESITAVSDSFGSVFPPNPVNQEFFYNTDLNKIFIYDGVKEQWTDLGNFGPDEIIKLNNTGAYTTVTPDRITFCIYLPSGAIGTLSNFTPRGYMRDIVVMNDTTNKATLLDMRSIFTENVDDFDTDAIIVNDGYRSIAGEKWKGPDFYLETKQYNFAEFTLKKWWRKLMFTLGINKGYMMVEFIDSNDNSLVSPTTGTTDLICNADESGFFLIPATTQKWKWFEENNWNWSQYNTNTNLTSMLSSVQYMEGPLVDEADPSSVVYEGTFTSFINEYDDKVYFYNMNTEAWVELTTSNGLYASFKYYDNLNNKLYTWTGVAWDPALGAGSTTTDRTWNSVFKGSIIRFSRWIGFRSNSLGFRLYSLRNYKPDNVNESLPEVVDINEWNFGLKPLRKGRN